MARPGSTVTVRRLLAMVPWVVAQDDPPLVDDVCARFKITRPQLEKDLALVSLVGLPPYTPDVMIVALVLDGEGDDGDRVLIEGEYFRQPLRLSQQEGLAVVAAGAAAAEAPDHDPTGPLARGVAKLAEVLGVDVGDDVSVSLGQADDRILADLRRAVDHRLLASLRYYSYARHASTDRTVEPLRLFSAEGSWYLIAYCRQAEAERQFRVDRINALAVLDETFEPRADVLHPGADFLRDENTPRVTIDVSSAATWVAQRYPADVLETRPDGGQRLALAVTAKPWLERLLLRLGPDGEVVDAPPEFLDARVTAAQRILGRYVDG